MLSHARRFWEARGITGKQAGGLEDMAMFMAWTKLPRDEADAIRERVWESIKRVPQSAEAENARLKAILRQCEWSASETGGYPYCHICGNEQPYGHAPDCEWVAALAPPATEEG